jgi:hypothetical protein
MEVAGVTVSTSRVMISVAFMAWLLLGLSIGVGA